MSDKKIIIPAHVGINISGIELWAQERNLPITEGYFKSFEKIWLSPDWFFTRGVSFLTFALFMSDDWNREREEVNNLMKLMEQLFIELSTNNKGYKILISGRTAELPGDLPEICFKVMDVTKDNNKGIINFCVNYSGRSEIVDAVRALVKNNLEIEQIHEGMIRKYLYNNELPDLDAIVSFSGEKKSCDLCLWRSAKSQIITFKDYWPEFEEADVDEIIEKFTARKNRLLEFKNIF